jgi:hypothetical protein
MNSYLNTFYSKLPLSVILIIFEYEGLAKENYDKFIKMFKKILLSAKYYRLAVKSYNDDNCNCLHFKSIARLNCRENYKYILAAQKYTLFCNCENHCCIKFIYNKTKGYNCGCHDKKTYGVSYAYHINGGKKILIRTDKNGFCVKII